MVDPDQLFKGSLTRELQGSALKVSESYPVPGLDGQSLESHRCPLSIREFT